MKKKILSLLLALCLVVGLLPVMALAEEAATAFLCADTGAVLRPAKGGAALYWCTVNGEVSTKDATGAVAGESNYNLKAVWPADSNEVLVYLKNFVVNNSKSGAALQIGGKHGNNGPYSDFAAKVIVESDSSITKPTHHGLKLDNDHGSTITSVNNAKLTITCGNSQTALFSNSALTLKDTNIALSWKYYTALQVKGNLNIENSTLDLVYTNGNAGAIAVNLSDAMNKFVNDSGVKRNILIKNSVVTSAKPGNTYTGAWINDGTVVIDNSSVQIAANVLAFQVVPEIKNCTAVYGDYVDGGEKNKSFSDYPLSAGTVITAYSQGPMGFFKSTHTCAPAADDKNCTTASACVVCGKELAKAEAAHKAAADDGDCSTAIKCANTGCEAVVTEAKTHVAGTDDGDCTTAVKCTNSGCTKDAVAAKAAHTGGTATCTKKAECAVCGKEYGELAAHTPESERTDCSEEVKCSVCGGIAFAAGQHSGGTATCTAKAKCEFCNEEYGELAAHTPAADDGDCTTAIKCTACSAEVVAAKTHAFTDAKDTTCDNEGCKHTRVVKEEKPDDTGDTMNLVLWFSVLAVSAIGFVSVLVFGKKRNVQ